jgi:diguanylate cyclase (GGDEF)-like protein
MRVIACVFTLHNVWLVALAAAVCMGGGWVGLKLFRRARARDGVQRSGWLFLASIAAGAAVWCTHFIAMLAYDVAAPVVFEPILTMASLLIAIGGAAGAFRIAIGRGLAREIAAGVTLGVTVAAMHYTGMWAYRVDGIVDWDVSYIAASLVVAVLFGIATFVLSARQRPVLALAMFVGCVAGLHFTGMTAVSVTPFSTGAPIADVTAIVAMAVAVAGVALIIVGTAVASYMIDNDNNERTVATLRQMAMNDALTGLPNRTSFARFLGHELERAVIDGRTVAVIGIDLDKFKEINDLRGHEAGDQALKIIADRMAEMLRDGEFVARIGGDEFAAVKRYADRRDLMDFVGRLEGVLFSTMRIDDFDVTPGASIGVSTYPADADTAKRLISNADLAMYRAKADVTRNVCFYEAEMDEIARTRRNLAVDLRRAIELDQLDIHYQPQTSLSGREVIGHEALLRWKHPEHGYIPPAEFIPLAEETGSILAIGEWVLREACREAADWIEGGKIAVNLSAVQLAHSDLPGLVHAILLDTGLPPSRLELEITESSIIQDKERSLRALRKIRALGVTIAIDDFGTGYSSLDTLRSFPFDRIKIDRSFMAELDHSQQARAIIRAVLALGKSLDINVLAEGVETQEQLKLLISEGCDEVQGYLFGMPEPREALEEANRSVTAVA